MGLISGTGGREPQGFEYGPNGYMPGSCTCLEHVYVLYAPQMYIPEACVSLLNETCFSAELSVIDLLLYHVNPIAFAFWGVNVQRN